MARISKSLYKDFDIKITSLKQTRSNFELARNEEILNDIDIAQAYAGLFLDLFTEFEGLLENLFIGLLKNEIKHTNFTVKKKFIIKPIADIGILLTAEQKRGYLDWLPYENTLNRAKIYFVNSKPFDNLSEHQKNQIKTYYTIRNAIAHKSKIAMDKFNNIINGAILLPIEKTPAGYLRSIPNPTTNYTQFEIACNELLNIANVLCC